MSALALMLSLTSCGTFISVGGGTYGYDDTYYDGYGGAYGYAVDYDLARQEAAYLSDKMAYELGLNAAQYDAVYEINLDYLLSMGSSSDLYGSYWTRRNTDLAYVLSAYQYSAYRNLAYFYRPAYWYNNTVVLNVYDRYNDDNYYYYNRPSNYASYRGGRNRSNTSYYANRAFGGRNSKMPTRTSASYGGRSYSSTRSSGNSSSYSVSGNSSSGNRAFGGRSVNSSTNKNRSVNINTNTNTNNRTVNSRSQNNNSRSSFGGRSVNSNSQNSSNRSFGGRSSSTTSSSKSQSVNTTRSSSTKSSSTNKVRGGRR